MTEPPLRIAIAGITGRMGREISALATGDPGLTLVAGIARHQRELDVPCVGTVDDLPAAIDVLIDFSTAEAALAHARGAAARGLPLVLGTTGIGIDDLAAIRALAASIPIWYARNMSYGVAIVHEILRRAARDLAEYDCEIVEMHHRNKVDAPSGTALALAETIQRARSDGDITSGRRGLERRDPGEIGIQSLRGGGNPGEHTIVFASDDEEIRVSHRALSRSVFAAGALRAARRIATATPGWYAPEGEGRSAHTV